MHTVPYSLTVTHTFLCIHLQACVMDDADPNQCSIPEHFEGNELEFMQDLVYEGNHVPMPKDYNYKERGMYAGGQGGGIKSFSFLYKLPDGISGDRVMLSWKYITANSVSRYIDRDMM